MTTGTGGVCGAHMSCASNQDPAQDKKLNPGEIDKIKKAGIDPHDLKPEGRFQNKICTKIQMVTLLENQNQVVVRKMILD